MSEIGPTLQTERLTLRPPRAEDLDAFAAMCADPQVMTWLGGAQSRPVAWRTLCGYAGQWALHGCAMFMVFRRDTGAFIGRVGPQEPEGWPGPEVGWGLTRDAQGHGFALEAAAAGLDFAFDRLGWTEAVHCIDPGNIPSQRLAERLGSAPLREATLPDPINAPLMVWGQTREAWRENRRNLTLRRPEA